ncbi:MAG: septum formation initiator family protein [Desulfobulbus sp.]|nr:septum formation initiator family protein [Desulfobulbus sp.]
MAVFDDRKARVVRGRQDDQSPDRGLLRILGLVVVALLLLWVLFAPGRGYYHFRKMQREIDMLAAENSRLEARNLILSEDIKRLKSDEIYIEEIARKKHGLLKKDETVFEFTPRTKKR